MSSAAPYIVLAFIYLVIGVTLATRFFAISMARGDLALWVIIVVSAAIIPLWPFIIPGVSAYQAEKRRQRISGHLDDWLFSEPDDEE